MDMKNTRMLFSFTVIPYQISETQTAGREIILCKVFSSSVIAENSSLLAFIAFIDRGWPGFNYQVFNQNGHTGDSLAIQAQINMYINPTNDM